MKASTKPKRRLLRFRLRTLLLLILITCAGMSWLSIKMKQASNQRATVEAIQKSGGSVNYEEPYYAYYAGDGSSYPAWAVKLLGRDFFFKVVAADAYHSDFGDEGTECLKRLPDLEVLEFNCTQISDAGLANLAGLARLKELFLKYEQPDKLRVTDAGLEYLNSLTNLQILDLSGTQVTGSGLEYLTNLTNLRHLLLENTQVTDAGLEHLIGLKNLESLDLSGTQVTDAGLVKLQGISRLSVLGIKNTRVTDDGVAALKHEYPQLKILR